MSSDLPELPISNYIFKLEAENQRLREQRAQVRAVALDENISHIDRLLRIEKLTREALAGDGEQHSVRADLRGRSQE